MNVVHEFAVDYVKATHTGMPVNRALTSNYIKVSTVTTLCSLRFSAISLPSLTSDRLFLQ